MNIRDWQARLKEIYPNQDMSPDYIMVHLSTKCSELSRLFSHQKHLYLSTDPYLLKGLAWLVAFCNHFDIDYEGALLDRFPGKCSYCLRTPCHCPDTQKKAIDRRTDREFSQEEIEEDLKYSRSSYRGSGVRWSFDSFRDQIFNLYPGNKLFIYAGHYSFPLGKLDEERGELHKAYSAFLLGTGTLDEVRVEVADVTAWLISFWGARQHRKSIDAELSSLLRNNCPVCRLVPCCCPRYSISRGEEELLRDIVKLLRQIKAEGIAPKQEVDDLVSMAVTVRADDQPAIRQSFFSRAAQVAKAAKHAPAITEGATKTVRNLEATLEALKSLFS